MALQKSAFKSIAVHLPIPNCRPVDLYVSPVANRHNATATRLFTGMHSRNLVSFFAKSGPTNRTMYSNVNLDILKFSFHHSSTKFPFNRASNQNWFLGHDHARLTRLVLRRAICSRINIIAFVSTSLGAAKVRAAAISIPGFADQEQENRTRGLQEPQLLF